jgi:pseudouridine-5'-phosphate glycosidase
MKLKPFLILNEEVEEALLKNQAVVALESTIITHGLPYPQNVEMARQVEAIIRQHGAIPATIAFLKGKIHVGLNSEQLTQLATSQPVEKISRRDIAFVLAKNLSGGTTVATTMWVASEVGIPVFATGGIGGVHRKAESTFDISSDLEEFTRSPVAVVSAGAKAILDLPKTLEYLETKGVPVIGFKTNEFPAFYYAKTGLSLKTSVDTIQELAKVIDLHRQVDGQGGVLIANPIPEAFALEASSIETLIQQAVEEAEQQHIKGYALTPFLLSRMKALTQGESVESNLQLVFHNAEVAAKVAVALKQIH